jgi:hypothetical protein
MWTSARDLAGHSHSHRRWVMPIVNLTVHPAYRDRLCVCSCLSAKAHRDFEKSYLDVQVPCWMFCHRKLASSLTIAAATWIADCLYHCFLVGYDGMRAVKATVIARTSNWIILSPGRHFRRQNKQQKTKENKSCQYQLYELLAVFHIQISSIVYHCTMYCKSN